MGRGLAPLACLYLCMRIPTLRTLATATTVSIHGTSVVGTEGEILFHIQVTIDAVLSHPDR